MATVSSSMQQYATHCASAAAGTWSAPIYAIVDTVALAVSIFVFIPLLRLLIGA